MDNIARIEDRIDKTIAGATEISTEVGGIRVTEMAQVFEISKLMAVSRTAVPKHLRENPGACFAVCIQALEWRMSPFAVANKSYEVNDRIAYEAQLVVAVINARAPLKERLRYTFEGEGPEMTCKVSGLIKGEATPLEYQSPKIKDIKVKNSPLWTSDPQQQLSYYSARAWARRHTPETILGIYTDEELKDGEIGAENAKDITPAKPSIAERLGGGKAKTRGFKSDNVDRALTHQPGRVMETSSPKKEAELVEQKPTLEQKESQAKAVDEANEVGKESRAAEQSKAPTDAETASRPADGRSPAATSEIMDATAGETAPPAELLDSPEAVDAEVKNKIAAFAEAETIADVNELLGTVKDYLHDQKRLDRLADVMSAAQARLKKLRK